MAIDVKIFGAKGDGIQDDSLYINNAISGALLLGEDLFISAGTYKCNQFVSGTLDILQLNQNGTKKIRIYGETGTTITTSHTSGTILYIYNRLVDSIIENIFFQNTHSITMLQTNAISIIGTNSNNVNNLTIRHCRFEGFSTAISAQGIQGFTIKDCVFNSPLGHDNAQNNTQPATFIWLNDNTNGQCYDVKILNNIANGYSGTDITKTITKIPMDNFLIGEAYGIIISGNITRNLGQEHIALMPQSISGLNYSTSISNNQFYQTLPVGTTTTSNYGIRCDCCNVIISNNEFHDYTQGILINPSQYPTLKQHTYFIDSNKFYSPRSGIYTMYEAIKAQGSSSNHAYNFVISNNFIDIDSIKMTSSRSAIILYYCDRINVNSNNIFAQNVNLNGYVLSGVTVDSSCINVINNVNNVLLT